MSWIFRSFCLATIVVALATSAHAEKSEGKIAPGVHQISLDKCLDTGDARLGTMRAIFECYTDELSRKDGMLNNTYRSVRSELSPGKQKQLQVSERGWIALRDKTCKAEADKEGGRGSQDSAIIWYACLIRETDRRIEYLKDFAR